MPIGVIIAAVPPTRHVAARRNKQLISDYTMTAADSAPPVLPPQVPPRMNILIPRALRLRHFIANSQTTFPVKLVVRATRHTEFVLLKPKAELMPMRWRQCCQE